MMSEQTVQSAMSIILHAGDARVDARRHWMPYPKRILKQLR